MGKKLVITEKDWSAIASLVDLGLEASIGSCDGSIKQSSYYGDYVQYRNLERRIDKQKLKGNKKR